MKEITLAKARKIDKEIGNVLNTQLKTNFKISKFKNEDDLRLDYEENLKEFNIEYSNILSLCQLKFDLRLHIQKLNRIGIDELLNLRQKLTAQMTIITNIVYTVDDYVELGGSDLTIIDAKMNKETDQSYHSNDIVDYVVINRDMINEMENNITFLRSELSGIDDELLKLNNSTLIELSDLDLQLLSAFKIVV